MPTPVQKILSDADAILNGRHSDPLLDWRDAAKLFQTAGEFGDGEGWAKLAKMYTGDSPKKYFKKDENKALQLYKKAISVGYYNAVQDISHLYEKIGEVDNAIKVWKIFFDNIDAIKFPHIIATSYVLLCFRNRAQYRMDTRVFAFSDKIDSDFAIFIRINDNSYKKMIDIYRAKSYPQRILFFGTELDITSDNDVFIGKSVARQSTDKLVSIRQTFSDLAAKNNEKSE